MTIRAETLKIDARRSHIARRKMRTANVPEVNRKDATTAE
jgi:hypothetical protein